MTMINMQHTKIACFLSAHSLLTRIPVMVLLKVTLMQYRTYIMGYCENCSTPTSQLTRAQRSTPGTWYMRL